MKISKHFFHKWYIMFMVFLFGARLLDKGGAILSPIAQRIGYADIMFGAYLIVSFIKNSKHLSRWLMAHSKKHLSFILFVFSFSLWTGLSWALNTITIGGDILDFFGIPVRVGYYAILSIFVAKWVKKYEMNIIILPFCVGILVMFYINFITQIVSTHHIPTEISEKNFSGLLLPIISIYLAFSILYKPNYLSFLLCFFSYISTLLVYSLGGYILMLLAFPAVSLSLIHYFRIMRIGGYTRALTLMATIGIFIGTTFILIPYQDTIVSRIHAKFGNIPMISETTDVESIHVRWGHFLSSMLITIHHPIFGVGEYNWEEENDKNRDWLGKLYMKNENPHNGIAQILSMFGIPAGIFFGACFFQTFSALFHLGLLKRKGWKIWSWSVVLVFLASANLMDTIFTTYYFYFFAALIYGINMNRWNGMLSQRLLHA